jgi:hypothetical protein
LWVTELPYGCPTTEVDSEHLPTWVVNTVTVAGDTRQATTALQYRFKHTYHYWHLPALTADMHNDRIASVALVCILCRYGFVVARGANAELCVTGPMFHPRGPPGPMGMRGPGPRPGELYLPCISL